MQSANGRKGDSVKPHYIFAGLYFLVAAAVIALVLTGRNGNETPDWLIASVKIAFFVTLATLGYTFQKQNKEEQQSGAPKAD